MTKIDIFSGFLGAGKTTLIKKLLQEAYAGEKVVLIENEFGQIGIDSGFLKECGVQITEMNQGCICCSLVGDFAKALEQVLVEFAPDRILIEPSGVGKLSDVIRAVQGVLSEQVVLEYAATVVDAGKCRLYMKNFGEFFNDQIESAGCIVLSHTDKIAEDNAYIHGQYLKSMKLPECQRNAEVIKSICDTVREAAYDEERNTEKKGPILFLTGEMDSCHYESASYAQKAAVQCAGLKTGFENILSRILDCKR